jgi:hypothetical protein
VDYYLQAAVGSRHLDARRRVEALTRGTGRRLPATRPSPRPVAVRPAWLVALRAAAGRALVALGTRLQTSPRCEEVRPSPVR